MNYSLARNDTWKTIQFNKSSVVIPSEWSIRFLAEGNTFISGGTPNTKESTFWGGGIPWMTPVEVGKQPGSHIYKSNKTITFAGAKRLAAKKLIHNDLIITTRGTVGNIALAGGDMYFNQSCEAIRVHKDSPLYLYFYLKTNRRNLLEGNSSTVFKSLTKKDLSKIEILYPPLPEQTAIANILSDQEALIAQYDNLIELHEKRFAYLSDELLSGRVRLVQKEVGEVELVKNNDWQRVALNGEKCQFPAGWFVQSIGKITKTVTGNTPATSNKTYWNEKTGTPWFSTPDLRQHVNGYISEASRYLTEQGVQVARVYPAKTLLVSCIATIGEVGLLPRSGSFNQQINGVLPNDEIDTNYLRFWFIYKKSDFQRFAPTSVVPIINKSLFNKFEVLYPPIEEQTLIANVLSDQEALIAQYKKLREAEKKRFDWLSDALLSGTYRVKVEA